MKLTLGKNRNAKPRDLTDTFMAPIPRHELGRGHDALRLGGWQQTTTGAMQRVELALDDKEAERLFERLKGWMERRVLK